MKTNMMLIVTIGFAIFSCSSGSDSGSSDEISGAYAKEYSIKVVNPEDGTEIGMRTIRDTILIRPLGNGYEVSNNKWRLNDYDQAGWQSMEHAEDRSMPTFQAIFNSRDRSLVSESMPHLFLVLGKEELIKDKRRDKPYQKIKISD